MSSPRGRPLPGAVLIVTLLALAMAGADVAPSWDGVARVKVDGESPRTLDKALVLEMTLPHDGHQEREIRHIAEVVAQAIEGVDGVVSVKEYAGARDQTWQGASGSIPIWLHMSEDRNIPYYGILSAHHLLSFIQEARRPAMMRIVCKAHKKAVDHQSTHRAVGYFDDDSNELSAYKEAADHLHPYASFYFVTDSIVAAHLKLEHKNLIHLYRPYLKEPTEFSQEVSQAKEILDFLQDAWLTAFLPASNMNINAPWNIPGAGVDQVYVFLRTTSPADAVLFKALRKLNKKQFNNPALHMRLYDPTKFPELVESWERLFHLDLRYPAIGVISSNKESSSWLNLTELQTNICRECVMQEINAWITENIEAYEYTLVDEEEEEVTIEAEKPNDETHVGATDAKKGVWSIAHGWLSYLPKMGYNSFSQSYMILGADASALPGHSPHPTEHTGSPPDTEGEESPFHCDDGSARPGEAALSSGGRPDKDDDRRADYACVQCTKKATNGPPDPPSSTLKVEGKIKKGVVKESSIKESKKVAKKKDKNAVGNTEKKDSQHAEHKSSKEVITTNEEKNPNTKVAEGVKKKKHPYSKKQYSHDDGLKLKEIVGSGVNKIVDSLSAIDSSPPTLHGVNIGDVEDLSINAAIVNIYHVLHHDLEDHTLVNLNHTNEVESTSDTTPNITESNSAAEKKESRKTGKKTKTYTQHHDAPIIKDLIRGLFSSLFAQKTSASQVENHAHKEKTTKVINALKNEHAKLSRKFNDGDALTFKGFILDFVHKVFDNGKKARDIPKEPAAEQITHSSIVLENEKIYPSEEKNADKIYVEVPNVVTKKKFVVNDEGLMIEDVFKNVFSSIFGVGEPPKPKVEKVKKNKQSKIIPIIDDTARALPTNKIDVELPRVVTKKKFVVNDEGLMIEDMFKNVFSIFDVGKPPKPKVEKLTKNKESNILPTIDDTARALPTNKIDVEGTTVLTKKKFVVNDEGLMIEDVLKNVFSSIFGVGKPPKPKVEKEKNNKQSKIVPTIDDTARALPTNDMTNESSKNKLKKPKKNFVVNDEGLMFTDIFNAIFSSPQTEKRSTSKIISTSKMLEERIEQKPDIVHSTHKVKNKSEKKFKINDEGLMFSDIFKNIIKAIFGRDSPIIKKKVTKTPIKMEDVRKAEKVEEPIATVPGKPKKCFKVNDEGLMIEDIFKNIIHSIFGRNQHSLSETVKDREPEPSKVLKTGAEINRSESIEKPKVMLTSKSRTHFKVNDEGLMFSDIFNNIFNSIFSSSKPPLRKKLEKKPDITYTVNKPPNDDQVNIPKEKTILPSVKPKTRFEVNDDGLMFGDLVRNFYTSIFGGKSKPQSKKVILGSGKSAVKDGKYRQDNVKKLQESVPRDVVEDIVLRDVESHTKNKKVAEIREENKNKINDKDEILDICHRILSEESISTKVEENLHLDRKPQNTKQIKHGIRDDFTKVKHHTLPLDSRKVKKTSDKVSISQDIKKEKSPIQISSSKVNIKQWSDPHDGFKFRTLFSGVWNSIFGSNDGIVTQKNKKAASIKRKYVMPLDDGFKFQNVFKGIFGTNKPVSPSTGHKKGPIKQKTKISNSKDDGLSIFGTIKSYLFSKGKTSDAASKKHNFPKDNKGKATKFKYNDEGLMFSDIFKSFLGVKSPSPSPKSDGSSPNIKLAPNKAKHFKVNDEGLMFGDIIKNLFSWSTPDVTKGKAKTIPAVPECQQSQVKQKKKHFKVNDEGLMIEDIFKKPFHFLFGGGIKSGKAVTPKKAAINDDAKNTKRHAPKPTKKESEKDIPKTPTEKKTRQKNMQMSQKTNKNTDIQEMKLRESDLTKLQVNDQPRDAKNKEHIRVVDKNKVQSKLKNINLESTERDANRNKEAKMAKVNGAKDSAADPEKSMPQKTHETIKRKWFEVNDDGLMIEDLVSRLFNAIFGFRRSTTKDTQSFEKVEKSSKYPTPSNIEKSTSVISSTPKQEKGKFVYQDEGLMIEDVLRNLFHFLTAGWISKSPSNNHLTAKNDKSQEVDAEKRKHILQYVPAENKKGTASHGRIKKSFVINDEGLMFQDVLKNVLKTFFGPSKLLTNAAEINANVNQKQPRKRKSIERTGSSKQVKNSNDYHDDKNDDRQLNGSNLLRNIKVTNNTTENISKRYHDDLSNTQLKHISDNENPKNKLEHRTTIEGVDNSKQNDNLYDDSMTLNKGIGKVKDSTLKEPTGGLASGKVHKNHNVDVEELVEDLATLSKFARRWYKWVQSFQIWR